AKEVAFTDAESGRSLHGQPPDTKGATAERREQSERPLRTPRARPPSKGSLQIQKAPPRSGASKASGLYARRERGLHPRAASRSKRRHRAAARAKRAAFTHAASEASIQGQPPDPKGATAQRREQSERPLRTPRARPPSKGSLQIQKAPPRSGASKASGLYARRERGLHPRAASRSKKRHRAAAGAKRAARTQAGSDACSPRQP